MDSTDLEELKQILENKDSSEAVDFARDLDRKGVKYLDIIMILQNMIIKEKDDDSVIEFATNVHGANLKIFESYVCKHDRPEFIFRFALHVKGANIERLQKAIIETGSTYNIYSFANNIPGADIPSLQKVIVESGNIKLMSRFALNVHGADVSAIRESIMKLEPDSIPRFDADISLRKERLEKNYATESEIDSVLNYFKMKEVMET